MQECQRLPALASGREEGQKDENEIILAHNRSRRDRTHRMKLSAFSESDTICAISPADCDRRNPAVVPDPKPASH